MPSNSSCIHCFCSAVNLVRNRFLGIPAPPGGGAVAAGDITYSGSLCACPLEPSENSSPSTPGSRTSGVSSSRCSWPWSTFAGMGGAGSASGGGGGGDPSSSQQWKLQWQPHAAHLSDVGSAGSPPTTA
uniref:Uncharacterized protein n=1 Tax=Oryza glumipatula TaxID=40148 RepID=A0A0E0A946_9ORYZ